MNQELSTVQPVKQDRPWAVIVAGPTCSGKSFLALNLAQQLNGVILNTDAMQCYQELRILTARPSEAEEQLVPHALYGVLPWYQTGNAGWWRQQVLELLDRIWEKGQVPILCGGTGMYFHSLIYGIADIPEPEAEIRQEARERVLQYGSLSLYEALLKEDPETALILKPTDSQRIARAWEVWRSTGKGLKYWQKHAHLPGADCNFVGIRLAPERSLLRMAVDARFRKMVREGALEEVEHFARMDPSPTAPLYRAHGVPEFMKYLQGEYTLETAIEQAVRNTQRYIKRQDTWFSHRILAPEPQICIFNSRIDPYTQDLQKYMDSFVLFIKSFVDG